jgi:hypothetical protein
VQDLPVASAGREPVASSEDEDEDEEEEEEEVVEQEGTSRRARSTSSMWSSRSWDLVQGRGDP